MKKNRISLLIPLGVAFLVAACQSAAPATPTPLPASPTPLPPPPTAELAQSEEPGCTVVSTSLIPDPPADSIIPSISEADWTQGPDDASVESIEYGDFQ